VVQLCFVLMQSLKPTVGNLAQPPRRKFRVEECIKPNFGFPSGKRFDTSKPLLRTGVLFELNNRSISRNITTWQSPWAAKLLRQGTMDTQAVPPETQK
jgi:hypothetical protein